MAISISQIDDLLNKGRDSLLSTISNTSGDVQLQSIFTVIAVLMVVVIFMELRKGTEERKGIWGPLAIMVLCLSVVFNFRITLMAWILLFVLGTMLMAKLKEGEWKGVMVILLVMYGLAFIISVNTYMMMILVLIVSAAGAVIKRANFDKVFGRSDAAKALREAGVPVTKERRILKALSRMARKGFRWSKDRIVRTAGKIKQRSAVRALRNEAEQLREAEIVIAGEQMSKALSKEEEELSQLESRDATLIEEINQRCAYIRGYIESLPPGKIETAGHQHIKSTAREIMGKVQSLVGQKLEEETIMEKSNKVFEHSMAIIQHSAHEATQLEEHKSDFREMKRAAMGNIEAMRKEIRHEERELARAVEEAKLSKAEGILKRIGLMKDRMNSLTALNTKLIDIGKYILKIDNILIQVTSTEKNRIEDVRNISEKAKHHSHKLHEYSNRFEKEEHALAKRHNYFEAQLKKEQSAITDAELSVLVDATIEIFDILKKMSGISAEYHEKELLPLVKEMADVARQVSHLSRVSEYLTKMYFRMSQANEALTKMAAEVDKNPESKKQLEQIWQTEDFESKIIRRAYRVGRGVVAHIKEGYVHLEKAYALIGSNTQKLRNQENMLTSAHEKVGESLNKAFTVLLEKEIKETKLEEKKAEEAQRREEQGLRSEKASRLEGARI